MLEIAPEELIRRLAAGETPRLLDVREAHEVASGRLPGALHVPRRELPARAPELLTPGEPVVVYCEHGVRSLMAIHTLRAMGLPGALSLAGGMVRWRELGGPVEGGSGLAPEERERYHRHLLLPEVGEEGQERLLAARVLLLGAGGLGSPAALYLAAAGVGTIGIADADVVELSNLQRQILHGTSRVGVPKVESAAATLRELNPGVRVQPHPVRVTSANALPLLDAYDVIVDGGDNFPTRYALNDAAVKLRKPLVHGSVYRFEGQVTTILPGIGPCYRCLFPQPPGADLAPSCDEAGVLGVLPGLVGTLQAIEVLKLVLGVGEPLVGRLLLVDVLASRFDTVALRRDPACPVCA
jgi:molybdopterin/thiamine biosynthesis adenylyltransferase/rhodanese-related sulfurtransferase